MPSPAFATTRKLLAQLVPFVLIAGCGPEAPDVPPADLVVQGAQVFTGASRDIREAFAVADGRFVAVGSNADVEPFIGPETEVIDADGAAVLPGLADGHVHIESGISLVRGVNLYGIRDKAEWLRIIRNRAAELPEGTWIVGGRWDHTQLPGAEFPTRHDLDSVAPNHPVVLSDVDGHSTWASTLAMELAGVDRDTPDPQGGRILKEADGTPSGIFLEAGGLVSRAVPALSREERRESLAETFDYAASLGLTSIHNMAGMGAVADYLTLVGEGRMGLRMWFGATGAGTRLAELSSLRDSVATELTAIHAESGPRLEVGYIKLVADGVLSSRTAVLLEPYADDPNETGLLRTTTEEMAQTIQEANTRGFPVSVHAIGDAAVRSTLDAFQTGGTSLGLGRNRIEHIEVLSVEDLPRFAALGVLASMNPHHCITGIDVYNTDRLGEARASHSFPWGELRDAQASLVFGSDWATAPLSPLEQLYAATIREKPDGGPEGGWHPHQRLDLFEAIEAYTLSPARAAGWDAEVGSIEPAKWADFVILDGALALPRDPAIQDRTVQATYVAGVPTYQSDPN